jgi:ferredoxin
MRIDIDRDRCMGAGQCVRAAREIFGQSEEDGLVVLLNADPPSSLRDEVSLAVSMCPTGTITVRMDE